jgi:hypothetical protein
MRLSSFILVGASVASALVLGACGSGPNEPGVATAASGGVTAAPPAAANVLEQYVAAQREWVKCMRSGGIDVSDPDSKGHVELGGSRQQTKSDPKFLATSKQCGHLRVAVPDELEEKVVYTREEIRLIQEYAKCMRANGEPSFHDPLPDGNWPPGEPDEGQRPSTEQEVAASLRAQQICAPVRQGEPPASPNPNAQPTGLG